MANNNENILVAGDAVLTIAIGKLDRSKWATSVDAVLAPEFAGGEIGFITEDGETLSRSIDTTSINMHQQTSVRTIVTGGTQEFSFSAGETNKLVQDLYYGTVKAVGETYRTVKAENALTITFNYDSYDVQQGFEKQIRLAGSGLIYPSGDVTFTRTGEAQYPFTIAINGDMIQSDKLVEEAEEDEEA